MNKGIKIAIAGIMAATIVAGNASAAEVGTVDEGKFVRSSFSLGEENGPEEEIITDVDKKWNIIDMTNSFGDNTREAGYEYKWTIKSNDVYTVDNIYRRKGTKIKVNCCIREGSGEDYVVAGIIEPDNTARAIKDEFCVDGEFEVEEDGYYSVFARNINDHSIKVSFIYYTYN